VDRGGVPLHGDARVAAVGDEGTVSVGPATDQMVAVPAGLGIAGRERGEAIEL